MTRRSPDWVEVAEASRLRSFLQEEVSPLSSAPAMDREDWFRLHRRAGELGFLCPWLPPALGGRGAGPLTGLSLVDEAARQWCHVPALGLIGEVLAPLLLLGSPALQRAWLPRCASGDAVLALAVTEQEAGSDPAAITAVAATEGEYFVVRGAKTFVSCAQFADLFLVAVRTGRHHRSTGAPPHAGISLLAIEAGTQGVRVGAPLRTLGLRHLGTADLVLEDVVVPRANLIGQAGEGLLALQRRAPHDRLVWSVMAAAMAETLHDVTWARARSRAQFGQPIGGFQTLRHRLATAATEVSVTRAFVDTVVRSTAAGEDIATSSCMARWWTSELVWRLSDECLQVHGALGYLADGWVGTAFADARAWPLIGGTTELTKETLGRMMDL